MATQNNEKTPPSRRKTLALFVALRGAVLLCMVRQLMREDYQGVFLCIAALVVMAVPALLHTAFRLRLPSALEVAIALFVFAAEILGEIANFYGHFPFWDTMLHTVHGFLAAAVGFGAIDLLNTYAKGLRMAPLFVALVSFCFSMTIGTLWEFLEFGADQVVHLDAQKDRVVTRFSSVALNPTGENQPIQVEGIAATVLYDETGEVLLEIPGGYLDIGLMDTMKDLFVNMVGALVFSVFGYLYVARRDKYRLAGHFQIVQEDTT